MKKQEEKILKLKSRIDSFRPFSSSQLQNLKDWFKIDFTTHSNAIEWNSFVLQEVKVLVEDWITVGWKTIREVKETENLANLTDIIWEFFDKDFILTQEFLFDLHKKLLTWIEEENLWKYRNTQVFISGSEDNLPSSKKVPELMENFIDFCNTPETDDLKILQKISQIHFDFVKIHPFVDWNWRLARLLMNLYLVKYSYLPIIFPVVTRLEYIKTLWKNKTKQDFYKYFLWQLEQNLNDYLRFFED